MTNTCLIAESDPFIARLLQRFAEETGMLTVHVRVGQDVFARAIEVLPAVLIIDADLPGKLRGWQAVEVLKQDQKTCEIPVITCGWASRQDSQQQVGCAAGHLQKPDLLYTDFVNALLDAGINLHLDENIPPGSSSIETKEP